MAETTVSRFIVPKRTDFGYGKAGQATRVRTNCFEIKQLPNFTIIHYDLKPSKEIKMQRDTTTKVWKALLEKPETGLKNAHAVYDGQFNVYSPKPLPFGDDITVDLELGGRGPPFTMRLRKVATINLQELHQVLTGKVDQSTETIRAISGLEMVLKYRASTENVSFPPYRAFYGIDGRKALPGALEVYFGWSQHLRPAIGRMYINLDVVATAFVKAGNLAELAAEVLGAPSPDRVQVTERHHMTRLKTIFKGVTFKISHRESNRIYKINKFTEGTARSIKFQTEEGKQYDLETYFRQRYNFRLRYPNLPCVELPGKNGSIFPMEVCEVQLGNKYTRKLADQQLAQMIRYTAVKPGERFNRIIDGFRKLDHNRDPHCQAWGIKVDSNPAEVPARILRAPKLLYGDSRSEEPRDGTWNFTRGGNKYHTDPGAIHSWAVMAFGRFTAGQIKPFVRMLIEVLGENGAKLFNKNPPIKVFNARENIEKALRHASNAAVESGNLIARKYNKPAPNEPQIVICIFEGKTPLYNEVKYIGDSVLGVPTSCADATKALNVNKQYVQMWALKFIAKLAGTNWCPQSDVLSKFQTMGTMVLGADVTHGETGRLQPSIAAVVGSMDKTFVRYAAATLQQGAREEKIDNMAVMAKGLIEKFIVVNNKSRPGSIILFRDGISEGQYEDIVTHELNGIREACRKIDVNYFPKITYVVVLKRHHVRFCAINNQDTDRSTNVKSGLVVDSEISHPLRPDFFLMTQAGLQGTSRPTHYTVIHDENGLTADDLQQFAYHLTYSFCRCPRAVGLTTPVYYAHLAAARAKTWSVGSQGRDDTESLAETTTSGRGSGPGNSEIAEANRKLAIHPRLARRHYFV